MFSWRAGTTPDQVARVVEGLEALPGLIPEIRSYRFGPDLGLSATNADFVLLAEFDSPESFAAYVAHEAHQRVVVELVTPIMGSRTAVQTEIGSVRHARDSDAWDLIGLVAGCWAEYQGCVTDVDGEVPYLRSIATHFEALGGRAWVVEVGGRVVASVGIAPSDELGGSSLRMLYVAAPHRRVGLGRRLVGVVEEEARRLGSAFVDLWSDTRFLDAHRLYENLGYTRLPETRELHDLSHSVEFHFRHDL